MNMVQHIGTASANYTHSVMAKLIAGLEIEFGRGAGTALAHHFIEAEESDFLWDARVEERWLGGYESIDGEGLELDRIAICGRIERRWFSALMLVDGNGTAHGTIGKRYFRSRKLAQQAMADAH